MALMTVYHGSGDRSLPQPEDSRSGRYTKDFGNRGLLAPSSVSGRALARACRCRA